MKLYKIAFDTHNGGGIRWSASKDGAAKIRAELRKTYAKVEFEEPQVLEVAARRADLVVFLNEHANGNA